MRIPPSIILFTLATLLAGDAFAQRQAKGRRQAQAARSDSAIAASAFSEVNLGFRYAAIGRSTISDLTPTLIRTDYYAPETYSTEEGQDRETMSVGLSLTVRPRRSPFYFETSCDHEWTVTPDMPMGTSDERADWDLHYTDVEGLQYWTWANYNYIVLSEVVALPFIGFDFSADEGKKVVWAGTAFQESPIPEQKGGKGHLKRALTLRGVAGISAAFNVAPREFHYRSNKPDIGPDLQIQENLRNTLTGKTNMAFTYGAELTWRYVSVFYRFRKGISDVIRTEANPYNMFEVVNRRDSRMFGIEAIFLLKR